MKKSHKRLEIVLLTEVEKLGKKGETIKVARGYAVNYLIPQDLAVLSDHPKAKEILNQIDKRNKEKEALLEKAQKQAQKINGLKIEFKIKTGTKGKSYGSVTKSQILKEIEKKSKVKLEKAEIVGLKTAIKKTGEYKFKIKLASGVEPEVKIIVNSENKKKKNKK